jgi:alpha-tubulin suppressor-like RCC1 family protein
MHASIDHSHMLFGFVFCFCADNGEVKCFGDNSKGQLGLGHKQRPGDLRTVGKLRNKAIKMIACGDEHSVALTCGSMRFQYAFDSSRYTQ